jgi:Zn-dependent M28 family amino/carboxypeptidase
VGACSGKPTSLAEQGKTASAALGPTEFDGVRAFEHVRWLVEMGPRPVGSAAHDHARDYIIEQLKALKLSVVRDDFTAKTPLGPRNMTNIIGKLPGQSEGIILIGSHYDTKLFKEFTFVGANDGGSSTGALLELARVLASRGKKPKYHIWFVFFDGEEAFVNWTQTDSTYGSRHLAEKWAQEGTLAKVRALILLDMIGDKDLDIQRDSGYSTPWLVDLLWATAAQLGYGRYFLSQTLSLEDDHVPFARRGVPTVDIIDFNYPYWHEAEDTLDKLSPVSLKIVGDVVIRSLPAIEAALAKQAH